jgi:hypothetical protein
MDVLGKRTRVDERNEERENYVRQRSHSNESEQSMLVDCSLEGLVLVSKINHRNRSFIPSSKNYFGGIQVKKVLCDTGCSTCLLPLEENQIDDIFLKFPKEDFIISINDSQNAGGQSPVLKIKNKDKVEFELKFCQDIIGNRVSISADLLRFSLCSSDVKKILETPALLGRLNPQSAVNLRKDAVNCPNRQRRTHALLGLSILKKLSSVRYSTIEFFVISKQYILKSWHEMAEETENLLQQIKLPDCFNDWEDDDKLGCDDAEDFEYEDE